MSAVKTHAKRILPAALLAVGVLLAFWSFIQGNASRISTQNEEYIYELTEQRAVSVDSLIDENLNFIRSTAYLYGKSLTSPFADVAVIRDYEESTVFDMLRFVDSSGDNYTSRGVQGNLADRAYFQAGMQGESGVTFVAQSRVTGMRQIGFYAPVWFEDEIIGIMVGFYGEEYIQKLLEYELFGYEGEGWLCMKDGTVLGGTAGDGYSNLFDYLREEKGCTAQELEQLAAALAAEGGASFTFAEGGQPAVGYAADLTQIAWVLLRTFPATASQQIVRSANRTGVRLIVTLVLLFLAYIVFVTVGFVLERRRTRAANRDANDISTGVARLFSKFILVDLAEETYRYLGGEPSSLNLPSAGSYGQFCAALAADIPESALREEVLETVSAEGLRRQLAASSRVSLRVHAPTEDGEWMTLNYIVLERLNGVPRRLLFVSQDVTQMHQREEEAQRRLERALAEAEKASRAKTEFLFNMSHDIRTPMNAIIGYTELAQREGVTEEEMREFIRKIDASSLHLLALINDILEMSRIESGKMTLEPAPTDLLEAMEEARGLFSTQMAGKEIAFTVDASGVRDRWVLCDHNRLNRILLNLLSNAFKFTGRGGAVSAVLTQSGVRDGRGLYELRVKDNGIGMSEGFARKLFNPFERERTSTVSGIQGTGLGLSITKSIVELMGGSIEVVTAQGAGTEFLVRLAFPLTEPETTGESPADAPAGIDFAGRRLLLVEDNPINREIASMLLAQAGFQLETAENGQLALDMVARSSPGYYDLVLMDIQMPVLDGFAATRAIRALENPALAGIPIVAMTANAFQEDKNAAREAGMQAHIAKPLDVEQMLRTITEVLRGEHAITKPASGGSEHAQEP